MKTPISNLSVYLIKQEFTDHNKILKDHASLNSQVIDGIGTLYYGESHSFKPTWISKFFNDTLGDLNIYNASSKAVLLIEVSVDDKAKRTFAIPFGYGWTLLDSGTWEERFGLKTTLNIIESDGLRKIEKKNMSSVPKDTSEQLSRAGIVADFGVDIEQDLIQSITGGTKNEAFGHMVTGKDALSISTKVNITTISSFLKTCFERYTSNDYKKNFDWIDQIAEIKNPKLIEQLDVQLLDNIKSANFEKTWMAVPEILEWEDVAGFKYSLKKGAETFPDIRLPDFLAALPDDLKKDLAIGTLKGKEIRCISTSSEEIKYHWKAYNCLYCEIIDTKKNKTYLLSNGKWFEIETNFAQKANKDYETLRDAGCCLSLPEYNHKNENEYNANAANGDTSFCCMDGKNISHGGGYSKIEFCDLLTKDNKIIHVKRYGGSSVLSHLFAQGVVSGELFLADNTFREKVNAKLADSHKLKDTTVKPKAEEYEVIFAIISASTKALDIPFFSKVSLRNASRRLIAYGYKVSLLKIFITNSKK
jgi:uncharacterized protein (TIGR04141 family)